ncbi:unnamed protein product, partial [Urochloa humidicola]
TRARAPRSERRPATAVRCGCGETPAARIHCAREDFCLPPKVPVSMSRQARKEAAAAARDLLKVDAARALQRKAATTPMRKPAVAPMRKDAAAHVLEQSSLTAATPPRSFTDGGSCFFNASAGDLFGSPGRSFQPWNHHSSDPAMCKKFLKNPKLETYNHLLTKDLSLMTDEEKLDHANTMKCLKRKLFAEN